MASNYMDIQYVQLVMQLNRINPEHAPVCALCHQPYEHFLIDCPTLLDDIRKLYIPPKGPEIINILYANKIRYRIPAFPTTWQLVEGPTLRQPLDQQSRVTKVRFNGLFY